MIIKGKNTDSDRPSLPGILHRYEKAELIISYKVRFIFYLCLTGIMTMCTTVIYTLAIKLSNKQYDYVDYAVVFAEIAALIAFIIILLILVKGYFYAAANLFMFTAIATVWLVMFLSRGSNTVSLLDSIVFLFVILSMTPLIVHSNPWLLVFYSLVNIPVLWIFMLCSRDTLQITDPAFYDYLADNSIGLIIICIITVNIFVINRSVFDRMQNDIRKRKSAEKALMRSSGEIASLLRFQKEMLDTAALWIDTADIEGNFTTWNRAAEMISGYSKEEVLGHGKAREWLYPDENYREMIFAEAAEVIRAGDSIKNYETRIKRKDGAERIISWSANYLKDENGGKVGILSIGADITERKIEQDEKEKLEEQLLQMQKIESIGRLAGGIAHDFNNLLTAILGTTELAKLEAGPDDRMHESFEIIRKAAESAAGLTRQLLSFSRKQIIEPRVINLNDLLVHMKGMLERMIGENIRLSTALSEDLCRIKADPGQAEQIIINLVVNARDAMPDGGNISVETANIHLDEHYCRSHAAALPGAYAMFSVSDTGHGMPAGIREHIFEPFFTTKESGKGTGLGLATVYGAVKQSGGFIEFYSEEGHGTTFKIYFPCVMEDLAPADIHLQEDEVPGGNETILVVEDNSQVLDFAGSSLSRLGYKVLTVMNGEDAVRAVRDYGGTIHMMMTDVILTGMNGRELADLIKGIRPGIKVLYNSGYPGDLISRSGIIEEGIHFIGKPFSALMLARKVRGILDGD